MGGRVLSKEIITSIVIALIFLSVLRFYGLYLNPIIGLGVSVYAFFLTVGQFLYKVSEFRVENSRDEKFRKVFTVFGEYIIAWSIMITIIFVLFASDVKEELMVRLTDGFTLLSLAIVFMFIRFYED
ncbi:hypothetical protein EQV77_00835 [Halobacillus fulvus]|nr:hypothetical protein EQV77_00835 [Halobacillus fulvus]